MDGDGEHVDMAWLRDVAIQMLPHRPGSIDIELGLTKFRTADFPNFRLLRNDRPERSTWLFLHCLERSASG